MNAEFWASTARTIVLSLLTSGMAAAYVSNEQATAIAAGASAIVLAAYSIYQHYGMRKVAETSVVTAVAPTVEQAKERSISAGK